MLRWNLFLSCYNTIETCGTAQAISLISQPGLEMGSKLVWAAPWEDWVSCMQSNGCSVPYIFLHIVFPPYQPLHTALQSSSQQTHSYCSYALTEEETLFLWGHSEGWAHLSVPSYLCSQLLILLSMTKSTLQAALPENTSQCPTANARWGSSPPRPSHQAPPALSLPVSFALLPTELQASSGGTGWALHLHQLLLMTQAEISPGYSWRGLSKCLETKQRREAELAPVKQS